jgi:transposase
MSELSSKEKYNLEQAYKKERDGRIKLRILSVIYVRVDGKTLEETSKSLRISIGAIQKYKQAYKEGGIDQLQIINCSTGRPGALNKTQQDKLKAIVSQGHYLNSKAVCDYVEKEFGVSYTPNAMTKMLKRLGFVHKKPKTVPGKANSEKQEAFLKETLSPLLKKAGEEAPVYFEDAVLSHN